MMAFVVRYLALASLNDCVHVYDFAEALLGAAGKDRWAIPGLPLG